MTLGRFDCPPSSTWWHQENEIQHGPVVVFPRLPVELELTKTRRVISNPNHLLLFNRRDTYRRRALTQHGDSAWYLALRPALLDQLSSESVTAGCESDAPGARLFRRAWVNADPQWIHVQRRLVKSLAEEAVDPLAVQVTLAELLSCIFRQVELEPESREKAVRPDTVSAHREVARNACEFVTRNFRDCALDLEMIARAAAASPFHLCRIFHAQVGSSLHRYVRGLRLKWALDLALETSEPITDIALSSGFASHSHFTNAFRKEFGITPTAVRDSNVADFDDLRERIRAARSN